MVEQGAHEPDVVYTVVHGVAAAVLGVPGEEPAAEQAAAVGIDRDEPLLVGQRVEPGLPLHRPGEAATAVEGQNDGSGLVDHRRGVHEIRACASVVHDGQLVVAGSQSPVRFLRRTGRGQGQRCGEQGEETAAADATELGNGRPGRADHGALYTSHGLRTSTRGGRWPGMT